jgi:hypothetical protein
MIEKYEAEIVFTCQKDVIPAFAGSTQQSLRGDGTLMIHASKAYAGMRTYLELLNCLDSENLDIAYIFKFLR